MRSQPKGQGLLLYRMYSIALTLVTLVSQIIISNQRTIHKTFFFHFHFVLNCFSNEHCHKLDVSVVININIIGNTLTLILDSERKLNYVGQTFF